MIDSTYLWLIRHIIVSKEIESGLVKVKNGPFEIKSKTKLNDNSNETKVKLSWIITQLDNIYPQNCDVFA